MRRPGSLSIAVSAERDPTDPTVDSGFPASLLGALSQLVGSAVPISGQPEKLTFRTAMVRGMLPKVRARDFSDSRGARSRLWLAGLGSTTVRTARDRATYRRISAAGRLDGLVQIGGEYPAPSGLRMVTFQDSTLLQAQRAYPWPHLRGLSRAEIDRRVTRQGSVYRSAYACCAVSHWVAESLAVDYGLPAERIHVIGLGTNHSFAEGATRRDWSVPRFLLVGVDWERKNGARVIDAFTQLRRDIPEATLDVVGEHPSLDVEGVRAHGRLRLDEPAERSAAEALFRAATAFLMPSLHEPFGIAYVEAAAAGIASIGTTNGGAATAIGDGGLLVDPASTEHLLDAMRTLATPDVAAELAARARAHAALFTWPKVAERVIRALAPADVDPSGLAEFL